MLNVDKMTMIGSNPKKKKLKRRAHDLKNQDAT
jgi:hypothetical protein